MTRYFILSFLVFAACTFSPKISIAAADKASHSSVNDQIVDISVNTSDAPSEPVKSSPAIPAAQPIQPVKAHSQVPTMDELAHIHHFHKGRVKKIKRHHEKFWALSKLLLVICHLVLIAIAFMHVAH